MSYDSILARSPSIIYQPGGVASELVVTTWTEVQNFVNARQGSCTVFVDDSLAPATVPGASGVTDFQGRGELQAFRQDELNYINLVVEDGAQLKNLFRMYGTINVMCDTKGAVPALQYDYTGGAGPRLYLEAYAFISQTATSTQPAIVVPAGHLLSLLLANWCGMALGNVTSPFISVLGQLSIASFTASLYNDAFTGPMGATGITGTGQVEFLYDEGTIFASLGLPAFGTSGGNVIQRTDCAQPTPVVTTGGATNLTQSVLSDQLEVTGALASNSTITIPEQPGLELAIINSTTGAFTVAVKTAIAGFAVAQGKSATGYVNSGNSFVRLTPDT